MKWYRKLIDLWKKLILSILFFIVVARPLYAVIFVYEVTTVEKRFITASKKSFFTFRDMNGGKDYIKRLKVLGIYDDNETEKAIKDFNLGSNNYKELLPENIFDNSTNPPYIWWR